MYGRDWRFFRPEPRKLLNPRPWPLQPLHPATSLPIPDSPLSHFHRQPFSLWLLLPGAVRKPLPSRGWSSACCRSPVSSSQANLTLPTLHPQSITKSCGLESYPDSRPESSWVPARGHPLVPICSPKVNEKGGLDALKGRTTQMW